MNGLWDNAKRTAGRVAGKAKQVTNSVMQEVNTFRGKTCEEKVQEYSEVYGEILLGLHKDVESFRPAIEEARAAANAAESFNERLVAMEKRLRRLQVACWLLGSLIIILGVTTWIAR